MTRVKRVTWRIEFRLECAVEGIYQLWFAWHEMKASNYDG